jgi:hypothetical protein
MSHAKTADKLLIKPAAGARPAPPRTRRQFIPKARTRRPVTRRVTRGTATTRLATAPDRATRRVLPSLERLGRERVLRAELVSKFCCPAAVTPRMHFHPDSVLPLAELQGAATPREAEMPVVATCAAG